MKNNILMKLWAIMLALCLAVTSVSTVQMVRVYASEEDGDGYADEDYDNDTQDPDADKDPDDNQDPNAPQDPDAPQQDPSIIDPVLPPDPPVNPAERQRPRPAAAQDSDAAAAAGPAGSAASSCSGSGGFSVSGLRVVTPSYSSLNWTRAQYSVLQRGQRSSARK